MEFFSILLVIIITAVFSQNFILVKFLGICPFLGVSKRTNSALSMGIAVALVMVIATLVTYPLFTWVMKPFGIDFLEIIFFIFIIAALVQMLEKVIAKLSPSLYQTMGIYLPLITTNCAILGVAELVIGDGFLESIGLAADASAAGYGYAILYALFAGIGFTLAMILMGGVRERIEKIPVAKCLKGFPITMVVASFMAMAFYVFTLL